MLGKFQHESLMIDAEDRIIAVFDSDARLLAVYGDYSEIERITGLKATSAIGRTPDEFAPQPLAKMVSERIHGVISTGQPRSFDGGLEIPDRNLSFKASYAPLQASDGCFAVLTLWDISERRSEQLAASRTHERYRQMIEQAHDVFMELDEKGRVEYVSPNAVRVLGHPADELHGTAQAALIHPDDFPLTRSALRSVIHAGSSGLVTVRYRHGDGHWIWLESSGRRYHGPDGVHVATVCRDVTNRQQAQRHLAESDRRYRILANSAFSLVVEISEAGLTRFVSPRLAERIGQPVEKLIGMELGTFVHPGDIPRAGRIFQRILDGLPVEPYMMRFSDGKGDWWYAELMGSVLSNEAGQRQILFFGRDITVELAEQEAQRVRESRLWSAERAESVALIARGVAHDLNNLLSISMGIADLLKDELLAGSSSRQRIDEIIEASASAAALSRQLAAVTRSSEMAQFETLDLVETTRSLAPLLRAAVSPGIRMHLDLAQDPCWIDADPSQIGQMLVNLVRNAAESIDGDRGEVAIRVYPAATTFDGEERVALVLKDTGRGIDSANLDRIFEPDFTTKEPGRGLGLSVVRRIVDGHGGEIRVESPGGGGASFVIEFPLLDRAPDSEAQINPNETLPASAWDGGKVLLVDDNLGLCKVVSQILTSAGFGTAEAHNADEALELLEQEQDLVCALVDVVLPGTSGVELVHQISQRRPALPVLWMTGDPGRLIDEGSGAGVVHKPFRSETLLSEIRNAIRNAGATPDQGAM